MRRPYVKCFELISTITFGSYNFSHNIGPDLEHLMLVNKTLNTLKVDVTAEEVKCCQSSPS